MSVSRQIATRDVTPGWRSNFLNKISSLPLPSIVSSPPKITFGTTQTITAQVIANTDPRLVYSRCTTAVKGATYPNNLYVVANSVNYGSPPSGNLMGVRFITDAPAFELFLGGYGNASVCVLVDGQPVNNVAPVAVLPNNGNFYYLRVDFGADTQAMQPLLGVSAGGSGFVVGDNLQLSGGTGTGPTIQVTGVSAGAITQFMVTNWGLWTVFPSSPCASTGGTGTGATFTVAAPSIASSLHNTRKERRVEVLCSNFGSLAVGALDTVRPWPVVGPRLIVFGDSYTEGVGSYWPLGSFGARAAFRLGIEDFWQSGVGSTGYLANGTTPRVNFLTRISDITNYVPSSLLRPYIVVVAGGINDTPNAALQTQVQTFWAQLFAALPQTYFFCVGPWRGPSNNSMATPFVQAGFAAAQTIYDPNGARSAFFDVQGENWQTVGGYAGATTGTGNTDYYTQGDGIHPTQGGHDYLGDLLANRMVQFFTGLSA